MATQIESTTYNHNGTVPVQVTVKVTTDSYAAIWAEMHHDDWNRQGWREELFQTGRDTSVQCLYDSLGNIWETHEYRCLEPVPAGYITLV